jgi:hypothetical protein
MKRKSPNITDQARQVPVQSGPVKFPAMTNLARQYAELVELREQVRRAELRQQNIASSALSRNKSRWK